MRSGRPRAQAWMIAAPIAAAYVVLAPHTADLAAASYRSYLFAEHGLTVWDNGWYAGHYLPAYSLLAPGLGALLSPQLLAALCATAAAAVFQALVSDRFPKRAASIASIWFAVGVAAELFSGRVPFDLGLAIGLGALLALERHRPTIALALALLTSFASPVAGAFLALAGLSLALGDGRRREGLGLTVAALLAIALPALAFPEGGSEPFVASSFWPALALTLVTIWAFGDEHRTLRSAAALYALALIGSFALATPVGGNAVRLGQLCAGPLAACALASRRARLLWALSPLLLYWQLIAPIRDLASSSSDPATSASYYAPLIGELQQLGALERPTRIEVPPTRDHWEARYLAGRLSIARGWERQLDQRYGAIFYRPRLDAGAYLAWLRDNAVAYVALPAAPLDHSAQTEAGLIKRGLPYLREVWRSRNWRLFAVAAPTPLAQPPAALGALGSDSFTLHAAAAGSYTVRVRYTPYWAASGEGGCIARAPGDWTEVRLRHPGTVHVKIALSAERIFSRGARCD
jgi:hypothetical protein